MNSLPQDEPKDIYTDSLDWDQCVLVEHLVTAFESELQEGRSPKISDYLEKIEGDSQASIKSTLCRILEKTEAEFHHSPNPISPDGRSDSLRSSAPNEKEAGAKTSSHDDSVSADFGDTLVSPPVGGDMAKPGKWDQFTETGYEVLGEIARGGMGVVYRARQNSTHRIVALKTILASEFASEELLQRFRLEAQTAAKLTHPGIVPIYEVGMHQGQPFFSMGLVEGESLAVRLREGPLAQKDAAKLIQQVAQAVEYAHQQGVIHRDLKPGNILIDADGQPYVTDFGLAKQVEGGNELTTTGQVLGTPSYMPPEQALGNMDEIGPQSDVYGLGAVLYAMLTGRPPFQAASVMETLKQVLNVDPVSPRTLAPTISRDLETICLKCLEKEPARRYRDAGELADDLSRYLDGKPITARPISSAHKIVKWVRRNPVVSALATVCLLAVFGFLFNRMLYQNRLTTALRKANIESARSKASEASSAAVTYDALVSQAEYLGKMRPDGYGKQMWSVIDQARRIDTSHRDVHQLRQAAIDALGKVGFREPIQLDIHDERLSSLDLSPDEKTVFVGTDDGHVWLCDRSTGEQVHRFACHNEAVIGVRFTDNEHGYTFTPFCRQVIPWHFNDGGWTPQSPIANPPPEGGSDVTITADGQYFIGWTNFSPPEDLVPYFNTHLLPIGFSKLDGSHFYLRPVEPDGQLPTILSIPATTLFDCRNNRFAAVLMDQDESPDGTITHWVDLRQGTQVRVFESKGNVSHMAMEPDGKRIALACHSGCYVYELDRGMEVQDLSGQKFSMIQFIGESMETRRTLAPPMQPTLIAHGSSNTRIFELSRLQATIPWPSLQVGPSIRFSSNGTCQFTIDIKTHDVFLKATTPSECSLITQDRRSVDDATLSADGTTVCCSRDYEAVQLWDVNDQLLLAEFPGARAVLSPSGQMLAISKWDEIALYSVPDFRVLGAIVNGQVMNRLRFSPDEKYLLGCGWEKSNYRIFRLRPQPDGKIDLLELADMTGDGNSADWCPVGHRLAWTEHGQSSEPRRVWIKEIDSPTEPLNIAGALPSGGYSDLLFPSIDEVCFLNRELRLERWNLHSSQLVKRSTESFSCPLARSPNGKYIVSGHSLIDYSTLETVCKLPPFAGDPWGIDWSLDGRRIVFSYSGGELAVWDMDRVGQKLSSLELDWPQVDTSSTSPLAVLSTLRSRAVQSLGHDRSAVTLQPGDQRSKKFHKMAYAKAFNRWTTELGKLSPDAIETLFDLSQNPPERSLVVARVLTKNCMGISSWYETKIDDEQYERLMEECFERYEEISDPTPQTLLVAAILYGGYAGYHLARKHPTDVVLKFSRLSRQSATAAIDTGEITIHAFGDRWFWLNVRHAKAQHEVGNTSEAVERMREALDCISELKLSISVVRRRDYEELLQVWISQLVWERHRDQIIQDCPLCVPLRPIADIDSWKADYQEGVATIKSIDDEIHFTTIEKASTDWKLACKQRDLLFEEGARYTIRFEARSPESRSASMTISIPVEDWHNIGLSQNFRTTPEFKKYAYSFLAHDVAQHHDLKFLIGDELGTLVLRNLTINKLSDDESMVPMAATAPEPTLAPEPVPNPGNGKPVGRFQRDWNALHWVLSCGGRALIGKVDKEKWLPYVEITPDSPLLDEAYPLLDIGIYGDGIRSGDAGVLANLPLLNSIRLSSTGVSSVSFRKIENLPSLQVLAINGTKIDASCLPELTRFPNLMHLQISSYQLERPETLAQLPRLTSLKIYGPLKNLDGLQRCEQLTLLQLQDNTVVSEDSVKRLRSVNPRLRILVGKRNTAKSVGSDPVPPAIEYLAEAGWTMSGNFEEWPIHWTSTDLKRGADMEAPFVRKIMSPKDCVMTAEQAEQLSRLTNEIHSLDVTGLQNVSVLVPHLRGARIGYLGLNRSDVSDQDLIELTKNRGIGQIHLHDTDISQQTIQQIVDSQCPVFLGTDFGDYKKPYLAVPRLDSTTEKEGP